jgi:hypothetical protein
VLPSSNRLADNRLAAVLEDLCIMSFSHVRNNG